MSTTARPILFSAPMIRALLDGRKTQTRRIVKPQPEWTQDGVMYWKGMAGMIHSHGCPYGRPGDLLWCRETWAMHPYALDTDLEPVCVYRATDAGPPAHDRWRPSIHMPRWASRLTLRITDVRVQRLQEISEEDSEAEGAFFTDYGRQCFHKGAPRDVGNCPAPDEHHPQRAGWSMVPTDSHEQCLLSPTMAFANLWESINGPAAWDANPFVWAISFDVIRANVDDVIKEAA